MKNFIDVRIITKQYETAKALNNVSLTISEGSLTAIVGKSGCGKAGSHKEVKTPTVIKSCWSFYLIYSNKNHLANYTVL